MINKIIINAIAAVLTMGVANSAAIAETKANDAATDTTQMGNVQGMEKCYGIAKKNRNDCGTASHGCAGEAKIEGDKTEWISVPTGTCNRIVGGSIKAVKS